MFFPMLVKRTKMQVPLQLKLERCFRDKFNLNNNNKFLYRYDVHTSRIYSYTDVVNNLTSISQISIAVDRQKKFMKVAKLCHCSTITSWKANWCFIFNISFSFIILQNLMKSNMIVIWMENMASDTSLQVRIFLCLNHEKFNMTSIRKTKCCLSPVKN